jgi:hypothetical protein
LHSNLTSGVSPGIIQSAKICYACYWASLGKKPCQPKLAIKRLRRKP